VHQQGGALDARPKRRGARFQYQQVSLQLCSLIALADADESPLYGEVLFSSILAANAC